MHPSRRDDAALRQLVHDMGDDVGAEAFVRQQTAVIGRADSRPTLACDQVSDAGADQRRGQDDPEQPVGRRWPTEFPAPNSSSLPDCGHLPQLEQPQATADALVEWLRMLVVSTAADRLDQGLDATKPREDDTMLRDDINNAVKDAMRAKDERKLSTLRMVNSTIKNADIAARGEGKPPL